MKTKRKESYISNMTPPSDPIQFIKAIREINSNESPEFKERKQREAEAIAEFVKDSSEIQSSQLATKFELKQEIESLKTLIYKNSLVMIGIMTGINAFIAAILFFLLSS